VLIDSPVPLQSNWVAEAEKFFAREQLQVKLWNLTEWKNDRGLDTVWVVKLSLLKPGSPFVKTLDAASFEKVQILSTWSDEGHIFGRSDKSQQNRILRKLTSKSMFNVLISGNLFRYVIT